MEESPTDPRVVAMLGVLFGKGWEKLEGDVAFEKTSMESWVLAVETMLTAADDADPIRVAIRALVQGSGDGGDRSSASLPTRVEE